MQGKRYYWLKLREDFFESKRIKKLRRLGETCLVIYLKMQLKALKTDGVIEWSHVEDEFVDELALDLDESPELVKRTLDYMIRQELCEVYDDGQTYVLPYVAYNTGSETAGTQRVRDYRERQRALHCNE